MPFEIEEEEERERVVTRGYGKGGSAHRQEKQDVFTQERVQQGEKEIVNHHMDCRFFNPKAARSIASLLVGPKD